MKQEDEEWEEKKKKKKQRGEQIARRHAPKVVRRIR